MGVQGAMAPEPAVMVAKRGPTPKKKYRNFKEQGHRIFFWASKEPKRCRALHSLKPLLVLGSVTPPNFR